MKILLTGGAGFIGSHVARRLITDGIDFDVVDNLSSGAKENLPKESRLIVVDILSSAFNEIVKQGNYSTVVHLAAQTAVARSLAAPKFDAEQNIMGTIAVLEAAKRYGVKRVIIASTAAVYGDAPETRLPISEEAPVSPMSFYGLSKLSIEGYAAMYQKIYGLEYIVLRFANVYGERQGSSGEGGVVSIFCQNLSVGTGLKIYGDGRQTRDFIYAGDVAIAIKKALVAKQANFVCNISTGRETSLLELVAAIEKAAEKPVMLEFAAKRQGDIFRSALSCEKAQKSLDWQADTPLVQGLKTTYGYFAGRGKE